MSRKESMPIEGKCDPQFTPLKEAFRYCTNQSGQIGQSLSLAIEGNLVVDLRAGYTDKEKTALWREDTLVCMMSVGKAVAAICALHAVAEGLIELDQKVTTCWPEYGFCDKEHTTLRHFLAHMSGVLQVEKAAPGSGYDREQIVSGIVRQTPEFSPGSMGSYHSFTYGYLVSEIIRRCAGTSIAEYLHNNLLPSVGSEYYFGVPRNALNRCSDIWLNSDGPLFQAMLDRTSLLGKSWDPLPLACLDFNGAKFRRAELPSLNGHGTTRFVAMLYSMLASGNDQPIPASLLREAVTEHWCNNDLIMDFDNRMGLGFMLPSEAIVYNGRPTAFGQPGANGAMAFGDTASGLGFCWVANYDAGYGLDNPLHKQLISALNDCF